MNTKIFKLISLLALLALLAVPTGKVLAAPTNITVTPDAIDENNTAGALVGTLSADGCSGTCSFSIVAGDDGASFTLDGTNNAELHITPVTNYETKPYYAVTIRATDSGGHFDQALAITINNVNEAPTGITLSFAYSSYDAAVDSVVGTLTETGDPEFGTEMYSFALVTDVAHCGGDGGAAGNPYFKIGSFAPVDPDTPVDLKVKTSPLPLGSNLLVCVRVTDTGYPDTASYTRPFTIAVYPLILSGTVNYPPCAGFKLGGGIIAFFDENANNIPDPGEHQGVVSWMDGTYSIGSILPGTHGIVKIYRPFGGYTFTHHAGDGSNSDEYAGSSGLLANVDHINFDAAGTRTISGNMWGSVLGSGTTSPLTHNPRLPAGVVVKLVGDCIKYTAPANGTGATTAYTIPNVPPKPYVLHPVADASALAPAGNPVDIIIPAARYANATFDDVTTDFSYRMNIFLLDGSSLTNRGSSVLGTMDLDLIGTGAFSGVNVNRVNMPVWDFLHYSSRASTAYFVSLPYLIPPGTNDPQPYTGNVVFTNPNYSHFEFGSHGPVHIFNKHIIDNITAYGNSAIYGTIPGYLPTGSTVSFGSTLPATIETANQFLLPYLEPQAFILLPSATGLYFTQDATHFTAAPSFSITATPAGADASGKFYAWAAPKPLSPANAANVVLNNPHTPTFTWEAVPGATSYDLRISTSSTFPVGSTTVTEATIAGSSYTPNPSLPDDFYNLITSENSIYWGVKANGISGDGTGHWTNEFPALQTSFNPYNQAPILGTFSFTGNNAHFIWTSPPNPPPFPSYKVEYSNSATMSSGVTSFTTNLTDKLVTIPASSPAKNWYWRVLMLNITTGKFYSIWSTIGGPVSH